MKANELRIGNLYWILHEDFESVEVADSNVIKLLEDYEANPDDECYSRGCPCDYYVGIPITPDWLNKFGAIFPYQDFRCQMGELCFYWNPNGALFLNDSGYNESITDYPINQVHQLQNLYFALTGSELTIKP